MGLNLNTQQQRVFLFLVAYRWASLLPALWVFHPPNQGGEAPMLLPGVLALAAGITLSVTIFHRRLNRLLIRHPHILGADMVLAAAILGVSGGAHSPYYLYALSPLLAGAFFFQMRGAVVSAAAFTPFFLLASALGYRLHRLPIAPQIFITQMAGLWLIPLLFGYPSVLLKRLRQAHRALQEARDNLARQNVELSAAHRQLRIIHDLTVSLQAASDVQSVQQRVLQAVTGELGFPRAIVGLVNPMSQRLENWRAYPQDERPPTPVAPLPLDPRSGLLVQQLLERQPFQWAEGPALTTDEALNRWLGPGPWLILPLVLREHPVGLLLVALEAPPISLPEERLAMLTSVAGQAAVALGTTMLCIDRAWRLAVEQERNRIARDIHDTVAQSLFGIVFTLDACTKMLPEQVEKVQQELVELRDLASQVRDQVRQSIFDIWPSTLTLERFKADLRKYVAHCSRPRAFHVDFRTGGDFDRLSPAIRRSLYRVAQEALANVVRHAGVNSAQVCLRVEPSAVYLSIQDHGRGFDPATVLAREHNRERFGLRGVRERIQALGGECEILSRAGEGTQVLVRLPVNGRDGRG
ncbi:MAG: GAF domain-containing sensor histidine kinase [Chloroflexi bacterium]|nr:MAG: GAF domain-containing sensor histidine kinase [Chloroflexota bacterium]